MASSCVVRKGECISWDFTEPFDNNFQDSPVFEIMNSKWMLKFHLYYDQQSHVNHYSIILIHCNESNLFKPFEITTYLEYRYSGKQHKCSHLTIKSGYTTLWIEKRNDIKEKLDLKYYPDGFTIICVFFPAKNISPSVTQKNDQSTQVSLECSGVNVKVCPLVSDKAPDNSPIAISTQSTPNSFSCKIADCSLLANKSPDNSRMDPENTLPNLESLSKDIGGMLSNSLMTDIELKCGKIIIPAHRAVLAARSEVFLMMFGNTTFDNNNRTVDIEDIDPSIFEEFLRYLYSGKLTRDLSIDDVINVYLASYKYSVLTLQKECSVLIAENLSPNNFITILIIAESQADKLLKDAIANFIARNPVLLKCVAWLNFSAEFPVLAIEIYQKYVEKALP